MCATSFINSIITHYLRNETKFGQLITKYFFIIRVDECARQTWTPNIILFVLLSSIYKQFRVDFVEESNLINKPNPTSHDFYY